MALIQEGAGMPPQAPGQGIPGETAEGGAMIPNEGMEGNTVDQSVMQGAMAQQGGLPPISQFE
jgi:hypothetical protein